MTYCTVAIINDKYPHLYTHIQYLHVYMTLIRVHKINNFKFLQYIYIFIYIYTILY